MNNSLDLLAVDNTNNQQPISPQIVTMSASVALHPLVLLNISDHYIRGSQSPKSSALFGVLMGHKTDDLVHITNSFELVADESGLDQLYLSERLEQQRAILPEEEVVGLYELSNNLKLDSLDMIKTEFEGLSTLLTFSPTLASKKYSNAEFYRVYNAVDGEELKVEIVPKESEKIAIDTVLDVKEMNSSDLTKVKDQVESQTFLLKKLKEKTMVIKGLLQNEENVGKFENYHQFLRDVNSFVHKLNYKINEETIELLVQLENQYNLLLNLGQVSDNLTLLNKINSDVKKVESMREFIQQ